MNTEWAYRLYRLKNFLKGKETYYRYDVHARWRERVQCDRNPGYGLAKTKNAVRRMREKGFNLFHVSTIGEEFSFIHVNEVK